jgi:hypothetical protein
MFEKLKGKIFINLFIIPVVLTVSISVVSSAVLSAYLQRDHQIAVKNSVELTKANVEFYLEVLAGDLTLLSSDQSVRQYAMTGNEPIQALQRINATVSSDFTLLGITLYRQNSSQVLASNGLSGLPTYTQITSLNSVDDFLGEARITAMIMRHQYIADNYDFMAYDESYGILSFFVKIYQDNQYLGLLVADLDSEYLYNTFFDYQAYRTIEVSNSFIAQSSNLLRNGDNHTYAWILNNGNEGFVRHSYRTSYFISSMFEDYQLVTIVDNTVNNHHILWLNVGFIIIDAWSILFAYWMYRRMAKQIIDPLNDIATKMEQARID